MKYVVHMAVDGRIDLEVEADSPEAAYDEAMAAFENADLSRMDTVEGRPVCCEDGTGAIIKEY